MYNFQRNELIRVTGINGAKAYQMTPNSSVALFDGDEDYFYIKTTDGAGFPTIRTFKFEEVITSYDNVVQITREEFEELKKEVEYVKHNIQERTEE